MHLTQLEKSLALYLLSAAKFEFYLIEKNIAFAKLNGSGKVIGVDWSEVAVELEQKQIFARMDMVNLLFATLKSEPPFYLISNHNSPEWKKFEGNIESWDDLLKYGLAQLRNNIAHGSKGLAHMGQPDRAIPLMKAGRALMCFIADALFDNKNWEQSVELQ